MAPGTMSKASVFITSPLLSIRLLSGLIYLSSIMLNTLIGLLPSVKYIFITSSDSQLPTILSNGVVSRSWHKLKYPFNTTNLLFKPSSGNFSDSYLQNRFLPVLSTVAITPYLSTVVTPIIVSLALVLSSICRG